MTLATVRRSRTDRTDGAGHAAPAPRERQREHQRARRWRPRLRWPRSQRKHRSRVARETDAPSPLGQWTNGSSLKTKAATAVIIGALILSPAGVVVGLVAASTGSESVAPSETVDTRGEQAAVEEFAARLVTTWLSVDADTAEDKLAGLVDVPDGAVFPSEPSKATDPTVADVNQVGDGTWAVTVAVTTTAPGQTQGVRRYYQVPIVYDAGRVAALALPAPTAAPAMAETPDLIYQGDLSSTDPAWGTVAGFLTALLAGKGDITRYLTPGTHVTPVSPTPYAAIRINQIAALVDYGVEPARAPADGEELAVLVTVTGLASATSADGLSMQYALVLTGRDGRWEVTEVEAAPHVENGLGELSDGSSLSEEEQ